jgi:hypothetical protein
MQESVKEHEQTNWARNNRRKKEVDKFGGCTVSKIKYWNIWRLTAFKICIRNVVGLPIINVLELRSNKIDEHQVYNVNWAQTMQQILANYAPISTRCHRILVAVNECRSKWVIKELLQRRIVELRFRVWLKQKRWTIVCKKHTPWQAKSNLCWMHLWIFSRTNEWTFIASLV